MLTRVSASLLNQIAPLCRTKWGRQTLALDQDRLATEEDRLYKEQKEKLGERVASAYVTVMPFLLENRAISRFLEMTERPDLRSALPELTTPSEAATVASMEFNLTPAESRKLAQALSDDLPS